MSENFAFCEGQRAASPLITCWRALQIRGGQRRDHRHQRLHLEPDRVALPAAAAALMRAKALSIAVRTLRSRISHSAMITACSYCATGAPSPQIDFAIRSRRAESSIPRGAVLARPWRKAFRLARALPSVVRGPVLLRALFRFAAILLSDVTTISSSALPPGPGLHQTWRSVKVGALFPQNCARERQRSLATDSQTAVTR